jgi:hypothetical protein
MDCPPGLSMFFGEAGDMTNYMPLLEGGKKSLSGGKPKN